MLSLVSSFFSPRFSGCHFLSAQATATANIVGVVSDATGAALPNATVTATNRGTNAQRTTVSNSAGQFRFDLLPAGVYDIKGDASGFSSTEVKNIELLVGTTFTANLPMRAGVVNSSIEVVANNQLVDIEKTDSSAAVTPKEIVDLPLNGRDIANLAILAPGVKLVDSYDPTKNRYAVYAVNGSSGRNTNTTVNGIDDKDNTVGGAVMQLPLEAVEEFKISTNRFSAENGRSEGAALNIVTKSGTNQFHGALYGFFRSQALQTNNAIAIRADSQSPTIAASSTAARSAAPSAKTRTSASSPMKRCASDLRSPLPIWPSRNSPSPPPSAPFPLTPSLPPSTKNATTAESITPSTTRRESTSATPLRTTRATTTSPQLRSTPPKATSPSTTSS